MQHPTRFSRISLTNAVCYDSWPIPSVKMMQRLAAVLRYQPEVLMYPAFVQLLSRGHDDQFQKAQYGERLATDLQTELQRIPGGRHFTPEDHPDAVAAAIRNLL